LKSAIFDVEIVIFNGLSKDRTILGRKMIIKQIKKKKATPFRLLGETYKGGSAFIEIVNVYSRNYSKKKNIYTILSSNSI